MPKKNDLPSSLLPAFAVSRANEAGMSWGKTRRYLSPFHGVRATKNATDNDCLKALMDCIPDQAFFCDVTAAVLQGIPIPWRDERKALSHPHIAFPLGLQARRLRREFVTGHRLKVSPEDIFLLNNMRLTSPQRTWIDLSKRYPFEILLASTDHLFRSGLGPELTQINNEYKGRSGARVRHLVMEHGNSLAESPMESLVRAHIIAAGLPTPKCNHEIRLRSGKVIRADMIFLDQKLILEYNGDYHRDLVQWRKDESRKSQLEELGYYVMVIVADDLKNPQEMISRISELLAKRSNLQN